MVRMSPIFKIGNDRDSRDRSMVQIYFQDNIDDDREIWAWFKCLQVKIGDDREI